MRRESKRTVFLGLESLEGRSLMAAAAVPSIAKAIELAPQRSPLASSAVARGPLAMREAAYAEAVRRVAAEFDLPGVVAGVWMPGRRVWTTAQGVADIETRRPLSVADHFPIRSITKSFTVTLILQMQRRGMLRLEDPISNYVPGIPNGKNITLADLAGMQSGVKNYTQVASFVQQLVADLGRPWTPAQLVDAAIPESPVFPPGQQYDYSNTNTILLGMVAETVANRPISALYRDWIFRPLGLRATSYPTGTVIPGRHPAPYVVDPATGEQERVPVINFTGLGAAGGMVSTLRDLAVWGRALGQGTLIGAALQQRRLDQSRPATNGPEYDVYGLGIGRLRGYWGHTGEALGFQAATFYDPTTRAVIAVATNSSQEINVATEVFKALAPIVRQPLTRIA